MSADRRITLYACWEKARQEFPDDPERRKYRFVELLWEHGHVVKRKPGESVNLPCGWPHRTTPADPEGAEP